MFRIIGGKHKNLRLNAPKNFPARPTTDRTKESVMNILNNYFDLENLDVLDLFSGTGNMSYEFCSRGCVRTVAVEKHPKSVHFIREMAKKLDFHQLLVIKNDVLHYLSNHHETFDIIYADPPYDWEHFQQLPELIFSNAWLKKDGWLIIEHDKHTDFAESPFFTELRKYGKSLLSIFKNT